MKRRTFLTTAAAVLPLGAGCAGAGGDEGAGGSPTDQQTSTQTQMSTQTQTSTPTPDTVVEIVSTSFDPRRVEVSVGATVGWKNTSNYGHTVTATQFHDAAETWSLDAGVPAGATGVHTFDSAGVYEYYCTVHGRETMCGVVLVGDATLDGRLPCSDEDDEGGY